MGMEASETVFYTESLGMEGCSKIADLFRTVAVNPKKFPDFRMAFIYDGFF